MNDFSYMHLIVHNKKLVLQRVISKLGLLFLVTYSLDYNFDLHVEVLYNFNFLTLR